MGGCFEFPNVMFSSKSKHSAKDHGDPAIESTTNNDNDDDDEMKERDEYTDYGLYGEDEYTDCEEFEDPEDAEWEYDDNGVAVYCKSGQPAMKVAKNELRLPMG